jgi:hypothetical protein
MADVYDVWEGDNDEGGRGMNWAKVLAVALIGAVVLWGGPR